MKWTIIIILLFGVLMVSGCEDGSFTEEELESIYNECRTDGKIPTNYFENSESMSIDEAIEICNSLNLSTYDELDCLHEKHNFTTILMAVECFDVDNGKISVYGDCNYAKKVIEMDGDWLDYFYSSKVRCK